MPELLSATEPGASSGDMETSRACCAELAAKQPKPQGAMKSASHASVRPSGHNSRLSAISAVVTSTMRARADAVDVAADDHVAGEAADAEPAPDEAERRGIGAEIAAQQRREIAEEHE